jgi:SAM-dependent methyltransferase
MAHILPRLPAVSGDERDDCPNGPRTPAGIGQHVNWLACAAAACFGESMAGFDDSAFRGDRWAAVYDERDDDRDPWPAVEFLCGLAQGGPALELGIGTGRVALPLAALGVAVHGLDTSPAVADLLAARPGGDAVPVTIGDIAEVGVTGPFRLVYLIANTLSALLDQPRQADCFASVARVPEPRGRFVVECLVPEAARSRRGQAVQVLEMTEDSAAIRISRHDAARQRVTTQVVTFDQQGMRPQPAAVRYSRPAELDRMAAEAGLRLAARYGDWHRRPFGAASTGHVSVYERS